MPKMKRCRTKPKLMAILCIATFMSIATYSYLQNQKFSFMLVVKNSICQGIVVNDTITPLRDNRTFIIAPYFDNRENRMIRVIAIVHHKEVKELYCRFCHPSKNETHIYRAEIHVLSEKFGFPYGATHLLCLQPKDWDPPYMIIQRYPNDNTGPLPLFEIRNREPEGSLVDFTVCISTMFGDYNNVLQFVQSMEMYKILGVGRVVIYKNNCSQLMEKVLDFYVAEGLVEIIPWPIDLYLSVSSQWHYSMDPKDIGYYGQVTALNDCVYRNMYRSKYVLLNDIDEIILPIQYPDWKSMMQTLRNQHPDAAVFLFENHLFPEHVFTPNDPFNISSWRKIPGTNILQHVFREPNRMLFFNPRKMIIDPRKVVQQSVHKVLQAYGGKVYVPMNVGFLFHCRATKQSPLPRESLIRDISLWRYNVSLVGNVSKVLHQIAL
ncbi:uncharacterized protein LOC132580007 [Heteronotia binoei]|uniref:uncharacterized protein LOC132580007 n=1 Tax=Heteronotia binoei TaxID=13085 RepID=UPI00292E6B01|nr:uncharacterized protein LOC132580007 [Heteronotia binoei]